MKKINVLMADDRTKCTKTSTKSKTNPLLNFINNDAKIQPFEAMSTIAS